MSAALAAEGENLTKLEKADVLELTVRHLHQLHRDGELSLTTGSSGGGLFGATPQQQQQLRAAATATSVPADRRRYQGGFLACAQQVASYVMKQPGLEPGLSERLLAHLARCSQQLSPDGGNQQPATQANLSLLGFGNHHSSSIGTNLSQSGLGLLPSSDANPSQPFPPFPLSLPADLTSSIRREYSITAQFQVYRPPIDMSSNSSSQQQHPSTIHTSPRTSSKTPEILNYSTADSMDTDDSVSPGSKRRASPEFPHIPKKRYAHCKFEEMLPSWSRNGARESFSEPTASTSAADSDSYVTAESLQQSPRPRSAAVTHNNLPSSSSSSCDGKDVDSMWRPW